MNGCRIQFDNALGLARDDATWAEVEKIGKKLEERVRKAGLDPKRVLPEISRQNPEGIAGKLAAVVDQIEDANARLAGIKLSKEVRAQAKHLAQVEAAQQPASLMGLVGQTTSGFMSVEKHIAVARANWIAQRIQMPFDKLTNGKWRSLFKSARNQTDIVHEIFIAAGKAGRKSGNEMASNAAKIIFRTLNDLRLSLALNGDPRPNTDALIQVAFDPRRVSGNQDAAIKAIAENLGDRHGDIARRTTVATKMVKDIVNGHGHVDPDTFGDLVRIDPSGKTAAVIEWRDADAFMAINNAFGRKDLLESLLNQVEFLAKREGVAKSGVTTNGLEQIGRELGLSANKISDAQAAFRELTSTRVPENYRYAKTMSRLRAIQTSAKLGSAVLSALSDLPVMIYVARKYYNVGFFDAITSVFAGKYGKEHAAYTGAWTEGVGNNYSNRYGGSAEIIKGLPDKAADFVLTASGLNEWTARTKSGFMRMLDKKFGQAILDGLTWEQISTNSPQLFHRMERFGITKSDWDRLSKDFVDEDGYFNLLRMPSKTQRGVTTRDRFTGFISEAAETGIVTPGFLDRRLLEGNGESEFRKLVTQFLSYGASVQRRVLMGTVRDDSQSLTRKATGLAGLMLSAYLVNLISVQAREVTKGNQIYNWDDPELSKRAISGLPVGLVYSLFMQTVGERLFDTMTGNKSFRNERRSEQLGVVIGEFANMMEYGAERFSDGKRGDTAQRKLVNTVLRSVPGQNLWITSALYRAAIKDFASEWVDPAGYAKAKRTAAQNAREQRQGGQLRGWYGTQVDQLFD